MQRSHRLRALAVAASISTLAVSLLAGCAPQQVEDSGDDSLGAIPTDHEGSVHIVMEDIPDSRIIESMVPEFNEVYPNIEVTFDMQVYDQLRDKIVASVRAPEATYDIFSVDNPWMTDFVNAGFLKPVEERMADLPDWDNDDYFESLRNIATVDGEQWGVPEANYAVGYIYRDDLMQEAGLTPPETVDDLVANVQAMTGDGVNGIAMQPQRGYKIMEEWVGWLFAAGGSIYDDEGNANLDTPEAAHALEAYIEAYETAAPENSSNWAWDEVQRAIAGGTAASAVSYSWALPVFNEEGGVAAPYAGDFKLMTMPGGKSALGSWTWGIAANTADSDAAWAFISWLGQKDVDAQRVILGGSPVRASTLEREDVLTEGYGEEYLGAVKALLSDSAPIAEGASSEEMIQAVGTELNEALVGNKSVEEALAEANDAITRIQGAD